MRISVEVCIRLACNVLVTILPAEGHFIRLIQTISVMVMSMTMPVGSLLLLVPVSFTVSMMSTARTLILVTVVSSGSMAMLVLISRRWLTIFTALLSLRFLILFVSLSILLRRAICWISYVRLWLRYDSLGYKIELPLDLINILTSDRITSSLIKIVLVF